MNGNPDTAADITQDVFLKLLENIQSVRKIGKFQNYLLTIAVNTCNNYTKKAKPLYMDLETLEDIEDTDNAFEKIELNELKAQIQYAINTLPDYQKEVIILRFYYDLKIREIATITKASVSTVKSRLQQGIKNWNDIWLILEEAIMYDPKTNGVLEWLQSCETPAPSEPKIKAVIVAGKSYMNSSEFNKNSMRDIILNQLQFLPLSFWIVQIILTICAVLLACILGQWRVPFYYPLTILAVMVPFLALLGAIEISKSNIYGMWEIEQSSRTTLVKIVAGRMLIIGVINLFLITVILISMAYIYQKSMIEMVLYGLIPFNISCTCYLFICAKSRTNDSLYHLIACMIFLSGTFSLVLHQRFIFEASMFWGWIGFYVLSIILLGKTLQLYLKKEKMIGELIWNLQ